MNSSKDTDVNTFVEETAVKWMNKNAENIIHRWLENSNSSISESQKLINRNRSYSIDCLIVEDINVSKRMIEVILKKSHYNVDSASDGVSAFDKYKLYYNTLKLILMDINLPDISGIEVTNRIREFEKSEHIDPCTIFGLTGNTDLLNLNAYHEAGMNGCIAKGSLINKSIQVGLNHITQYPGKFVFINRDIITEF